MISILLVDDHKTFLAGTALILEKHGFRVTTASTADEALEAIRDADFELYLFDLKLPGTNGFELTEQTLRIRPEAAIVILTGEDIAAHYDRLMDIGAIGVLEKSLGEPEFVASLRLAVQRLTILPLHLARQLRTKESRAATSGSESDGGGKTLTEKEIGLLKLIAQGHKNKDIADRLYMSQRNVEYMISHLFAKLNAGSRQEAVLKAIELKWLKLDS
ncbi:response regulator transcription factor [Paenibacillus flagellatus]|nr:response regulator transcription factor [Paenibacillus flagellatus]